MSLAWELNDQEYELKSFSNLSVEYYYAGDLERAEMYHDRFMMGRVEAKDSQAKKTNIMIN